MNPESFKKVLIITYYWPPSGGSSVLRWLKFTKYLQDFGWLPTIYTPSNPEPQAKDLSLQSEVPHNVHVIKRKITEPYFLFRLLTGKKSDETLTVSFISDKDPGPIHRLLIWVRGNFFIPDARKWWIKPSVRFLIRFLKQNPHDIIISTGPPHSMHLIALGVKKKLEVPWISDFRDPWTNIDFYDELRLSARADRQHHLLERKVLDFSDAVIAVSPTMAREFTEKGCKNVYTITNGFDEQDMIRPGEQADKFIIIHIGSMSSGRNPDSLWSALNEMGRLNGQFKSDLLINLTGDVDFSVIRSIEENGLLSNLVRNKHIPHSEVLTCLMQASVLLLVINNSSNSRGILTNKFFEYLSARKPIIAIGPVDGDVAAILNRADSGKIFDYKDKKGLSEYIMDLYGQFKSGRLYLSTGDISRFSRQNLTSALARLLNSVTTT